MKRRIVTGFAAGIALVALCASAGFAQNAAPAPAKPAAAASDNPPMVPPAKPGVFTAQKKGATGYHLVVAGHKFTTRDDIEKYLAYRAAELTMEDKSSWFTFVEA